MLNCYSGIWAWQGLRMSAVQNRHTRMPTPGVQFRIDMPGCQLQDSICLLTCFLFLSSSPTVFFQKQIFFFWLLRMIFYFVLKQASLCSSGLAWNLQHITDWPPIQWSICLCFPGTGIKDVYHHSWTFFFFWVRITLYNLGWPQRNGSPASAKYWDYKASHPIWFSEVSLFFETRS